MNYPTPASSQPFNVLLYADPSLGKFRLMQGMAQAPFLTPQACLGAPPHRQPLWGPSIPEPTVEAAATQEGLGPTHSHTEMSKEPKPEPWAPRSTHVL